LGSWQSSFSIKLLTEAVVSETFGTVSNAGKDVLLTGKDVLRVIFCYTERV
jgi:hypothetical protein